MRRIERREWLLWSSAILVTLLLTLGILSFSFPMLREYAGDFDELHLKHPIRFARCRRESHSTQFRSEEKAFTDYARATRFLARFPAPKRR